ncbi:hypothetical protein AXF42_Ash006566 [Apostasia shenzhenica]|uniref:Hyaluronan/mRNA-binding protein domain-containing protein n=1 Tax=Apostasia shenzhenica TaxID=1088818 RepID=A0A2I0AZF8_9ASPA|nr:hypothetical protein AXF42_Ash006566 [Apostasia shenzhenica]
MARLGNSFALLGEDDDGADVSLLIAKVEAKISAPELPKEMPPVSQFDVARGRGRGGRGRGSGRVGFGSGGGEDAVSGFGRGYGGEYGGVRGRGRAGRSRGRGRGFGGFRNENQSEYSIPGDGRVEGSENLEKGFYAERRPFRHENRRFGEEDQGLNFEERENRGFRGYGADWENRDFRNGEGNERRVYDGDVDNRGFRGRGYGGRGRRGGRDAWRVSSRFEKNETMNEPVTRETAADENDPTVKNKSNGESGSGWDAPDSAEELKDRLPEPVPEQVAAEDASKVTEVENTEMTLAEYEKMLQEKRKALEAFKTEERKVVNDKDFEGMLLVEKKKEEDLVIKMKFDKEKGKRKEVIEKEEKSRKSLSINEFLKPAEGERYGRGGSSSSGGRGGGRGRGRGGLRGGFSERLGSALSVSIEDDNQFPVLGAVVKA